MDTHVKVLAVIFIIGGICMALLGLVLFGIIAGAGAISGEQEAVIATGIIGTVLGGVCLAMSIPSLVTGFGLMKRREWARILGIVLCIIQLIGFPIGTAIGIYGLWVLFNPATKPVFATA